MREVPTTPQCAHPSSEYMRRATDSFEVLRKWGPESIRKCSHLFDFLTREFSHAVEGCLCKANAEVPIGLNSPTVGFGDGNSVVAPNSWSETRLMTVVGKEPSTKPKRPRAPYTPERRKKVADIRRRGVCDNCRRAKQGVSWQLDIAARAKLFS